ncbi:MAG: hypothetical protein MK066_05145 [Crocinitomicaceae bacterium]|nr:hypothetical protein [Crocinitomicaceae bacterium]
MSFSEFDKSMQRVMQNNLELPSELSWEKMSLLNSHEKKRRFGFFWFSWLAIGLVFAGGITSQLSLPENTVESDVHQREKKTISSDHSKEELEGNNVKLKDVQLVKDELLNVADLKASMKFYSKDLTLSSKYALGNNFLELGDNIEITDDGIETLLLRKPTAERMSISSLEKNSLDGIYKATEVKRISPKYEVSLVVGTHASSSNYSGENISLLDRIESSEKNLPSFSTSLNVQRLLTKNIGVGMGVSHRVDLTEFSGSESLTPEFFYENGVLIRRTRTRRAVQRSYKQVTSIDLMLNYRAFFGQRWSLEITPIGKIGLITGYRGMYYGSYGGIALLEKGGAKEFEDRVLFNVGLRIGTSYQLTSHLRLGAGINMLNQLKKSRTQINGIDGRTNSLGVKVFLTRSL